MSCLLNHPGELPCKKETVYRFSSGDLGVIIQSYLCFKLLAPLLAG